MTALYMDGFDHYGDDLDNMANAGWSIVNVGSHLRLGVPSWGARTGTSCLVVGTFASGIIEARKALSATTNHLLVSFGYSISNLPSSNIPMFTVRDSGGASLYTVGVTPTGAVYITGSTINAVTAGPVFTPQVWHFFEMEFDTANDFTLRVDDALASEAPVLTTAMNGGTIAMIDAMYPTPSATFSGAMDDLFVRDGNGAVNNGFLGDRRIATIFPNGDSDDAGWEPHYYKQISVGHVQLANIQTGASGTQSATAAVKTNPATALNIGSQDFTLESWVRFDRLPLTTEFYSIFSKWNESAADGRSYQLRYTGPTDGNVLEFRTSTDGTSGTVVSKLRYPWQPDYGTWYLVSLCRTSGELLLFVDGEQLGLPITDADTYFASTTSALAVGAQVNSATSSGAGVTGSVMIGRMDETRFTNGLGRYSSSFTPPTDTFPRGAIDDPDWASVVLLMGYDQAVTDESSFARAMVASNGATNITATDGDPPGAWTTVGKATPNDNTFIQASLTNATNIFTLTTNPTALDTVTVGTTDGVTPAVYKFVSSLVDPFDVLIGADYDATLANLIEAINAGAGAGTVYGTGTTSNSDVVASSLPSGQILVTALIAGTVGNSIAVAESSPGVWTDPATLTGGADIPGRSSFRLNRPPTNTTIISAVQLTMRAKKSDSGVGTIKAGLIGPLGGLLEGPDHPLSVTGTVYSDIIEADPDTAGPISPTTLVNGRITVNRTA